MSKEAGKKMSTKVKAIIAACIAALAIGGGVTFALLNQGSNEGASTIDTKLMAAFWPDAFVAEEHYEPPFTDDPNRTNNAFNVIDFGEQGSNGWFYRFGDYKRPERSERASIFDGERYGQSGASGFEIKSNFVHTAERISPILEWRAAQNGAVNVTVSYVKNVNGDANPSYPDGVQLLVYKGSELLELQNVPISTTEEIFAQIKLDNVSVEKLESLYFVVNPSANNAYDGGSLYIAIEDVNAEPKTANYTDRPNNNANSVTDFGEQGSNGWTYLYGTDPSDLAFVSHETEGEYINSTSPSLSIKKDFIHPSLNHNAVLGWVPAVDGDVELRIKYTKFEQHDGMPDFPDGIKLKAYKNNEMIYEQDVEVFAEGENMIKHRIPSLSVTTSDQLYFMVDCAGNSSYDGGALDVTIVDINGVQTEADVAIETTEIRQNVANVMSDFGPQGSNGWFFQSGYGDDPNFAYNMDPFDKEQDRYFSDNWLEIKRDYVNTGEHDSSTVIKWIVAQDGTVSVKASYTKMKNEDANPDWPDGTRVSLYLNDQLLLQETFEPEVNEEVTKRMDISSLKVSKGDHLTMVVNGINNNAYDGGKYEFSVMSLSGLVGNTEKNVPPTYPGARENFASTLDDFNGKQGNNGWYYQYGYNKDPFCAVNIEKCENNEKWYTSDGVEIKKDYIVPGPNGKTANVKWIAAESGTINIDLSYTKLKNEDANPSYPDGVTVYLMKNGQILKSEHFDALTDREVTKDLSVSGVKVNKGDAITMIVDPGANSAYDGGKYSFVIEDAAKTPTVRAGSNDNTTNLANIDSMKQGTDGWWFLEGTSPSNAKVLTKMIDNNTGYGSRRTEGLVMKKDFVHTGATLDPIYQWVVGENGKIDIAGSYVKFGQEDSNPSWPDGVTVKIYHNGKVLFNEKVKVLRGDGKDNSVGFSFDKVSVKRGDKISFQICADGNYAWDGGRLAVFIEPSVNVVYKPGDDNKTVLGSLDSLKQGTDGWYFMEGTSLDKAKPLSEMNSDKTNYISVRDPGVEMGKDYVHTGPVNSAIYRWVVKESGKIDVYGSYVKFGHNDKNASWPDGVRLIIYRNKTELLNKKVAVKKGDGNDNLLSFSFDSLKVNANDILSFRIVPLNNNAWDGGRLSVGIEPTAQIALKPGDDNSTVLGNLESIEQGSDGWYFMEGTSLKNAKPITNMNDDKSAYVSVRDSGLEMKKDYVHPGIENSPIYRWVVKEDGKVNVSGSYVKFGQNDEKSSRPDGITLVIYHNNEVLMSKTVKALKGEGNDNLVSFSFDNLSVKANDVLSFQIKPNSNNAWDAGRLSAAVEPVVEIDLKPGDDNNTSLGALSSIEQGTDGWYFMEGTSLKNAKPITNMNSDKSAYVSVKDSGLEMKKDYVHPGIENSPIYRWVVKEDGKVNVNGSYVKFGHNDSNPSWPDGVTLIIYHNNEQIFKEKVEALQGDGNDNTVNFKFDDLEVKANDILSFQISPDDNNAWDAGRLSVTVKVPAQADTDRTNNTILKDDFTGEQGKNGWYYGMCDWDSKNFTELGFDAENDRYYNNGKPELKADFVEPGNGRNAAYKWVAAQKGKISVKGEYVKFANNEDPSADGVSVRIFLNGVEKKWMGNNVHDNFSGERSETFDEVYEVNAGDELIFAVNPEGNDSYDGGRLSVTISDAETDPDPQPGGDTEPDPDRENNTVLKDDFTGEQGKNGWYYGMCDWDSKNFANLSFDAENNRYYNNGKPELKADFVEPGNGRNAAYKWVAAKNGTIYVKGEYVKFANNEDPSADGTCIRIFLNGVEKKWMGDNVHANFSGERSETFDEVYEVNAGDELIFAVNPEGNDSYDGGRLSVTISDKADGGESGGGESGGGEEPAAEYTVSYQYDGDYPEAVMNTLPSDDTKYADGTEVTAKAPETTSIEERKDGENGAWTFDGWEKDKQTIEGGNITFTGTWTFARINKAELKSDFGEQGKNGWHYGMCDWDSKNYSDLKFDSSENRYYNNGKPELKADFVEPGGGRNAAYKWVAAEDGSIRVKGEYVKFANNEDPNADGVCVRIFLNGVEKKWMGNNVHANFSGERSETFDEVYQVKKGDELIIAVSPEENDSYDGGRLTVSITPN